MSSLDLLSASSHTTSSSAFSRSSRGSKCSVEGRSQTHWKLFRNGVLAPHHIRILDSVPTNQLPDSVVEWVNANRDNVSRFARQREDFRKQVALGRGFGDSALFPHEVLPWTRGQPFIAKCMVPTYSSKPLPQRMVPDPTGKLGLAPPRPGFACGFSSSAFGPEELKNIPDFLATSGTTLEFDTGSITPDSALYCPFMTFERAFYQQKYGLEIAANQCAVDGAWCVRALQMLHEQANGDSKDLAVEEPVAFTCAIDNHIAIINYHWVDHARTFCMAPVIKFELSRDDHFNQFLIWIEAVGQWAISIILPEVKKAICLINDNASQELALTMPSKGSLSSMTHGDQSLVSALRLSYENIPWRMDNDDVSAVSSSTASWGSPVINEAVFSKFRYPVHPTPSLPTQTHMPMKLSLPTRTPPRIGSVCSEPNVSKTVRFADVSHREHTGLKLKPALNSSLTPWSKPSTPESDIPTKQIESSMKSSFDINSDLVMSKRLGHAMDEIKDLQRQMMAMKQEFGGSTMCLQDELSGLRNSMTTVLRKERLSFKQGSAMRNNPQDRNGVVQLEQHSVSFEKDVTIITTPTDPAARPNWLRNNGGVSAPRRSSGLQNVLSLDTTLSTSITTTIKSACMESANGLYLASGFKSPTITIYSPTIINVNTTDEVAEEEENGEKYGAPIRVPRSQQNDWSSVLASHVLCALVPSAMLRVILFGLVLDYCMVSMSGSYMKSFSHYISDVLEAPVTV